MSLTDPYFEVKDEIELSLQTLDSHFTKWYSVQDVSEKQRLRLAINNSCKNIVWQVDELKKALEVAESNPKQYNVTFEEIQIRKNWVEASQKKCNKIASKVEEYSYQESQGELYDTSASSRLDAAIREENNRHLNYEQEQQQILLRQQDEDLDKLGEHVILIGQMGKVIGEELGQQNALIDELNMDIESTTHRLAAAQKRMTHILQKAGLRGQLCIIIILIILFIILVMIAIS